MNSTVGRRAVNLRALGGSSLRQYYGLITRAWDAGTFILVGRPIREVMKPDGIRYSDTRELTRESILALYEAHAWSSAEKPELLHRALVESHSLVTAWEGSKLVGLGNAISDGSLVVYYPHLLVLPAYQGRGIGKEIMRQLVARYQGFHQHMIVADRRAVDFYRKCGFERAGATEPLWIYRGHDH